ncbi:zinc finger c2hc domain-containing protein 1c [Holotrichia oblita]|uniref:Zinc finger c2hc domain-containing protein 1c n=1 Tax=Holotrichia oblita TaxID=644536 RepID=A0ACB9TMI7_HOLOL|nr:zinc finger c2hc domain-containing protein 1c [Holotrichia oblita]
MQEKEEKLLKLYENQQKRTIERVSKGSAGSDGSITTTMTTTANLTAIQGGKVRQMFDERRQKAGIDRSYPLEPLKPNINNIVKSNSDKNKSIITKHTVKSTVQKSLKTIKNGKPGINKREAIEGMYTNENGNENFEEQRHNYENELNDLIEQDNDLVNLMNNHNLGNNIDDEEMPNVELDDSDEPAFTGKLANVGGILVSQIETNRKSEQKNPLLRPSRKPVTSQPPQKKTTVQKATSKPKQVNSKDTPTRELKALEQSNTSVKNKLASPNKLNMSTKRSPNERVPSTNRPSARQTPRGPPSAATKDDLSTCKFCNRRFAPDRLQIHEDICARTGKKKRKTYDALKHRVQGTELEPFARKSIKVQQKVKLQANNRSNE